MSANSVPNGEDEQRGDAKVIGALATGAVCGRAVIQLNSSGVAMSQVMRCALVAASLTVGCSSSTAPLLPLEWQKVQGPLASGALLASGAAGAFDEKSAFTVTAFKD